MIMDVSSMSIDNLNQTFQNKGKRSRYNKKLFDKKSLNSSVQQQSSSLQLTQDVKECRICLDSVETDVNQLIAPCNCTGSVRYVHTECYKQWIEKQYSTKSLQERQTAIKNGVLCQLCKCKIYLQFKTSLICTSCQRLSIKINHTKLLFSAFMILIILNLGCIGYLLNYSLQNLMNFNKHVMVNIILLMVLFFLALAFIISIIQLLKIYLIQSKVTLQKFNRNKSLNRDIISNQIYPEPIDQIE